jgi:methylated-DNA-[protein]-cysteine S-methyltransferase
VLDGLVEDRVSEATDRYEGNILSPIGWIRITVNANHAVTAVGFVDGEAGARIDPQCAPAVAQLEEYFDRRRRDFDVELEPSGTDFERRVWTELGTISYGTTITYGEIARRLGDPDGSRAVGIANARNPIAIMIPCHRVIGADGDLTGYAGGLERKRWLLAHESGQASLF